VKRLRWDRESAIAALRREAARLGRTPSDRDLRSPSRTCAPLSTYYVLFGSLGAAQIEAGLPMNTGGTLGWRKARCVRGHERTADNVGPQSHCRVCDRERKRRKPMEIAA
jgi:hypothetical protein